MRLHGETLPGILLDRFQSHPDEIAVVLRLNRGETSLSVRRLVEGALGWAARLHQAGILPGEVVIDLLPPGEELMQSFFGAMFVGAVPSILPFLTENRPSATGKASTG
jgi:acyl-CoA synthetase (AMP-forming)/AMP-acid ligase II